MAGSRRTIKPSSVTIRRPHHAAQTKSRRATLFGPSCRVARCCWIGLCAVSEQQQTTNLGVRSSNFGRANKISGLWRSLLSSKCRWRAHGEQTSQKSPLDGTAAVRRLPVGVISAQTRPASVLAFLPSSDDRDAPAGRRHRDEFGLSSIALSKLVARRRLLAGRSVRRG